MLNWDQTLYESPVLFGLDASFRFQRGACFLKSQIGLRLSDHRMIRNASRRMIKAQ